MGDRIQLLECTIRDGALGLEDAWINNLSDAKITADDRDELGKIIASVDSEIVEIGSIEISAEDKKCFDIYQSIEDASKAIPTNRKPGQLYCAMFKGPDTPLENLPEWTEGLLDGVRIIIRYSELKKSLEFCEFLSKKGFKVFIQPMATMRYTPEELEMLIEYANRMNAYALYFVDSYGYMMPEDILRFTKLYDKKLNPNIRIGFHAHNNTCMAFANAIAFLNYKTDRKIIVDSTASGMGQGAGNLQTELIADYLNKNYGKKYDYSSVMNACDFVEKYNKDGVWGYSVTRAIPAINRCAYKYAIAFRRKYNLSYSEMNDVFSRMPADYQHRYTEQFAKEVLSLSGFDEKITE